MTHNTENNHLPFMDAARGILMSLGVLLHAANVFSDTQWAIQNGQTSVFFTFIVDFIHYFRMPAFFIVSGFFCHMSLKRYGNTVFIKKRVPRILVPMLITALLLNTLQNLVLSYYNQQPLLLFDLSYWLSGKWVSHLWFLHCILFFFLTSILLYKFAHRPLSYAANISSLVMEKSKGSYLLLLPIGSMVVLKISYAVPETSYYTFSIGEAISFSLFFAFGALLNYRRKLINIFIKPQPIIIALIVIIILASTYIIDPTNIAYYAIDMYVTHLLPWLLCLICFYIFLTLFNRPSTKLKYLAAASYSVYLFHHLFIIVYGIILINLDINLMVKFFILISLTYITTLTIHHFLILRFKVLHYLFNGYSLYIMDTKKSISNNSKSITV